MPSALVILPPGAEEIEFVGSVDLLRRAGVSIMLYIWLKIAVLESFFFSLIKHF